MIKENRIYGILNRKAAISFPFNLYCKAIAAFFLYSVLLRTLLGSHGKGDKASKMQHLILISKKDPTTCLFLA